MRLTQRPWWLLIPLAAVIGCAEATPPAPSPAPAPVPAPAPPKVSEAPRPADIQLSEKDLGQIAKLPASEQEIARTQKVCLINKESPLGAMGVPYKVTYEGKVGFLCCPGCEEDFKANPAAAFASLTR